MCVCNGHWAFEFESLITHNYTYKHTHTHINTQVFSKVQDRGECPVNLDAGMGVYVCVCVRARVYVRRDAYRPGNPDNHEYTHTHTHTHRSTLAIK